MLQVAAGVAALALPVTLLVLGGDRGSTGVDARRGETRPGPSPDQIGGGRAGDGAGGGSMPEGTAEATRATTSDGRPRSEVETPPMPGDADAGSAAPAPAPAGRAPFPRRGDPAWRELAAVGDPATTSRRFELTGADARLLFRSAGPIEIFLVDPATGLDGTAGFAEISCDAACDEEHVVVAPAGTYELQVRAAGGYDVVIEEHRPRRG